MPGMGKERGKLVRGEPVNIQWVLGDILKELGLSPQIKNIFK